MARYEWTVGSAPCATDVQAYSDVGLALRARMQSSAGLAAGRWYFVTVRATDGVGRQASRPVLSPDADPESLSTVHILRRIHYILW